MPDDWLMIWVRIGVAALGGLAVGIEREWSIVKHRREPHFAGVRTFLLLGVLGALSALLAQSELWLAGAALILAAAALTVLGYVLTSRRGDVGGTTEVAGLLVVAGGLFAGLGKLALASGIFALMTLVLIEKSRMHRFVSRIQSTELLAAARFAVLALVVFPLLPLGPMGPAPGVRPRELWALALVFSGLSYAGFLALRLIGGHRGYHVVGLLGGLVSSTAVTMNFSRESRQQPQLGRALALGVIAACSVLPLRTLALILLLNPPVGHRAIAYLLPPAIAGLGIAWWTSRARHAPRAGRRLPPPAAFLERPPSWWTRNAGRGGRPASPPHAERGAPGSVIRTRMPRNPLRFIVAIQMVLAFQAVLYAADWVQRTFGASGLLSSAALLGLTDVDGLIYSMVRLGGTQTLPGTAAQALAVGVLANTLFKCGIVLGIGRAGFRGVAAAGLLTICAATLAALLLIR